MPKITGNTTATTVSLEKFAGYNASNAIKSSASGEVIRVDDVCPIGHTVNAKISGENIEAASVTVTRCSKNILGFTEDFSVTVNGLTVSYDKATQIFTLNGTPTASGPIVFSNKMTHRPMLKTGTIYTLSLEHISGDCSVGENNVFFIGADNTPDGNRNNWTNVCFVASGKNERSAAINYNYLTGCWVYIGNNANASYTDYKFRVQLEKGEVATDYELHKCETHTSNADGTLEFKSVSPTMTFLTDTVGANIDVEYNQDINSAIGDYIKSPETAQVGQTLVVKEVDEKGKPITWESANIIGGDGNMSGWTLIGECETTEEVSEVRIVSDTVFDEMIAFVSVPPIPEDTGGTTYVRPVLKNQGEINANVGLTKPSTKAQYELWYMNRMWGVRQYWKSSVNSNGTLSGFSEIVLEKIQDDFDNGGGLVGFSTYWNTGNKFPSGIKMRVWGR